MVPLLPCVREVPDPLRNRAQAQPLAEIVAEVATIARQDVVVPAKPRRLEVVEDLRDLLLGQVGLAHGHGLPVAVALALPGHAAEDAAACVGIGRVGKAPLEAVDLDCAVEDPCPTGSEQPVQRPAGLSNVVDVQSHGFRLRCLGRLRGLRVSPPPPLALGAGLRRGCLRVAPAWAGAAQDAVLRPHGSWPRPRGNSSED
mmetsp:Transcript_125902/g.356050  ORF Transcript_125902/g.356050 Transcript_125902/m.356050 type:complete len:200 (+) Transcript_125902:299-898(+)